MDSNGSIFSHVFALFQLSLGDWDVTPTQADKLRDFSLQYVPSTFGLIGSFSFTSKSTLRIRTMVITCASPGCENTVTGNLACPTCKKYDMDNYFCSQDCFKKNWAEHKKVHVIAKKVQAAKMYVLEAFLTAELSSSMVVFGMYRYNRLSPIFCTL